MDPKQHRDAVWFALAGPKSGEYLASQQAQDCASEKGAYEIMPLGGEEGYYWKWVRKEEPDELPLDVRQKQICCTCAWYVANAFKDGGVCHKEPPSGPGNERPSVHFSDFCSHHKLNENKV